jgi:hypothetical protein
MLTKSQFKKFTKRSISLNMSTCSRGNPVNNPFGVQIPPIPTTGTATVRNYVNFGLAGNTMGTLNSPFWAQAGVITNAVYWNTPPITSGKFYLTGFNLLVDNDNPPTSGNYQIRLNYSVTPTLSGTYTIPAVLQSPIYKEHATPVELNAGDVFSCFIDGNATGSEYTILHWGYFESTVTVTLS